MTAITVTRDSMSLQAQARSAYLSTDDFYRSVEALKLVGWSERPAARAVAELQRTLPKVTHLKPGSVTGIGQALRFALTDSDGDEEAATLLLTRAGWNQRQIARARNLFILDI